MAAAPPPDHFWLARRLAFAALLLGTLLLPGASDAQSVGYTTGTSAQYQAPASQARLPHNGGTQQAKVFNKFPAAKANITTCPAPTEAQCATLDYLFTGCGQAHQATCKELLTASYKEYFKNLAPKGLGADKMTREMFPFGSLAQFKDLRKGKFHATLPTAPVLTRSTSFWDQTRIVNPPAGVDPKTYVAHPPWEADGAVVKTCQEYAYEKYYDWHRFQDAVSLCKGDYLCAMDIAYVLNGPPGVAKRNLKRKDGQSMSQQLVPGMPTPKNVFFTMGRFVTAEVRPGVDKHGQPFTIEGHKTFTQLKEAFPQYVADFDELKAALEDGATYYGRSQTSGVNSAFSDTWDFHSTLRTRTANISENEFEEFARRRAELEFYVGSIIPGVDSGGGGGGRHFGLRMNEYVHPLAEVERIFTYDPWERINMFQDANVREQAFSNVHRSALQRNHAALFGTNGATVRVPANTVLRSGQASGQSSGGAVGAMGVNQASATPKAKVTPKSGAAPKAKVTPKANSKVKSKSKAGSGVTAETGSDATTKSKSNVGKLKSVGLAPSATTLLAPQFPCQYIPPMDVVACDQNALNCQNMAGPEAMALQNQRNWNVYAKCKVLNLTLMEWWRRKSRIAVGACNDRGSCGCLDLNSSACDWSPKMFYDAYVGQAPGGSNVVVNGNVTVPAALSYLRDADYDYCRRWTFGGFPTKAADRANGDKLEAYLAAKRAEIEKILKNIPQKKAPNGDVIPGLLGEDFSDAAREGDADSWSAGYNMASGWEVKPTFTGSNPPKTCWLQGSANASFAVNITTPIDGAIGSLKDVWNHAVDADVWVRVNNNNDKKVHMETHLLIADQEIFAAPEPYNQYKQFKDFDTSDPSRQNSFSLNKAFERPLLQSVSKTNKLTLTVWAGPIPITGSVWAELSYGVNAIAKGETGDSCNTDMTKFEVRAGFEPFFTLTGALSLGVGVGGIVSAGIRGYVELIDAGLPIAARTWLTGEGNARKLNFGVDASLDLSSLSGRLALYVEFLLYEEEFQLFHWRGVHTSIPLLRAVDEKFEFGALAAIAAP